MARLYICLSVLLLCGGCTVLPHLRDATNAAADYALANPMPTVVKEDPGGVDWVPWALGAGAAVLGAAGGAGATSFKKKGS